MIIKDKILDFASEFWGEDRLCLTENLFCVLDGATPIEQSDFAQYHSSAEWMADRMAAYIVEEADRSVPYPLICKEFVDLEADILRSIPVAHHLPCLTTSALQYDAGLLKCWVLGDCSIYLLMKNGEIRHITDQRVKAFSQKTIQCKAEAIRRGEDPTKVVLEQRIQNKKMMNHPDGYWTVGFVGSFESRFVAYSMEAESVQAVLLCTDGLDRLFSYYDITPKDLLTEKMTLEDAVRYLRQRERSDQNTEIKRHDDVGAILLKNP